MKLVIAEKPSVAMSLAAVLGANEKKDGYLEGGGWLVSWCVGHLLELAPPEAYGEQYARWRYGDLPILPDEWKYEVPKDKKKQLDILCRLMKDGRVDSGYRGEIHAIISNVSSQTQELTKGSRVGQLVITPVVIADFVSELGEQRGTGAFGSTGK